MGDDALVSSRYIREIASRGGDVGRVVPPAVVERLSEIGGK
jgi:phosphopantetheine adenylyltransferase